MVRVFIKGGVWKNSEDEILKAAVMKYGKQQWARVASLLNRKSAKQCKARWNEWLDPSIKKLEDWSREEDERLLHLSKLMPAQFKTIGPLVGNRTAQQCLERYERLLDQAATASDPNHNNNNSTNNNNEQLRPGDIDAHPETKPARPDPIDMDEDEMEMLQEARARLANTQGKKAKRKAREKMLKDAKRLADLQKRRELKQAGLLSGSARQKSRGKRHRREIDLGVEIPFYKPARSDGQYDTTLEDVRAYQVQKQHLTRINYKQINEQAYNTRDREQKQAQKKQEARLRQLERDNMQYVVSKVSQINDPISSRKRPILSMPPPTNTNNNPDNNNSSIITASNNDPASATSVLLQDLGNRPLPTPMRTPATQTPGISRQQAILREASQLRSLQQAQTPLLLMSKHDHDTTTTDQDNDTNNINNDRHFINATPGAASVMINDDTMSVGTTSTIKQIAKQERRAAKRIRLELEQALSNLPAPQFEYELAVPTTTDEDEENQDKMELKHNQEMIILDQADKDAMEIQKKQMEQEQKYQTSVFKLNLPRPLSNKINYVDKNSSLSYAQQLIEQEHNLLLQHDAYQHPIVPFTNDFNLKIKKKKSSSTKLPPKPSKPLDHNLPLELAQQLLQEECNKGDEEAPSYISSAEENEQYLFVPGKVGWTSTPSDKERVKAYQMEYKTLTEQTTLLEKQCHKLQSKLDTIIGGYAPKLAQLQQSYAQLNEDFQEERTSKHVYATLHKLEQVGLQSRLSSIQKDVHQLQQNEIKGQKLYGDLLHEKNRLVLRLKQ